MRCRQAERWFSLARDDELSSRRRRRLAGHLRACPDCRDQYRRFWSSCRLLRAADPARDALLPPALADAIAERLRRQAAPAPTSTAFGGVDARVALGIAATLALLLWGDRLHVLDELPDVAGTDSVLVGGRR